MSSAPAPASPATAKSVVILGRPNVGKSTLFNLLTRGGMDTRGAKQTAVTHPTAGTTRDVRRVPANLFGLHFQLFDTAGVEEGKVAATSHGGHRSHGQFNQAASDAAPLQATLNRLAYNAAEKADVVLFVIDGESGVTPADRALAQRIRKMDKPIILIMNKADLRAAFEHAVDAETLGFGAPIQLSAAHSQGLDDLHQALSQYIEATPDADEPAEAVEETAPDAESEEAGAQTDDEMPDDIEADKRFPPAPKGPIKVAILGRPNVGKSTLINALLEDEAMLTGPVAGLTREAISHPFTYGGQQYSLIDTPGLRRKGKVDKESLEFLSVGQSLQATEAADVIILVLDASTHNVSTGNWEIFEQQDAQIAAMAMHQFKPMIVALNKWDAVADKSACLDDIAIQLHHRMHAMHSPLALPISSLHSKGLPQLMQAVSHVFTTSYATFSTGKLNNLLAKTLAKRSPPLANGKAVSLKFIRQSDVNPPTFTFWGNRIDQVSGHYKQFLRNQLAEALGLQNLAVKILFKANANPFGHKSKPMKSLLKPKPKRA